jgi:hypothetical protein
MEDNMDTTDRRIAALLDLIVVLDDATRGWHSSNMNENRAMENFKLLVVIHWIFGHAYATDFISVLSGELDHFYAIKNQPKTRQFLAQEDDKQNIVNIFERVNEARRNMIVGALKWLWLAKLDISHFS